MEKLTQKQMFEVMKGHFADLGNQVIGFATVKDSNIEVTAENVVDFINGRIEVLSNKTSRKAPTKTQVENENIKALIVDALSKADKPMSINDLMAIEGLGFSNQKLSALLTQLVDNKVVVRVIDKKKVFFSIA